MQINDLAAIAAEVARETRLAVLDRLHQKNPSMPYDPLLLCTFKERLRDFFGFPKPDEDERS